MPPFRVGLNPILTFVPTFSLPPGSADKTIKVWKQHKCIKTITGHTGVVRGLALIPDIGFASCSNDRCFHLIRIWYDLTLIPGSFASEVRVWTTEGDVVYTLSGHTSFVYSLTVLPNGDIASAGEDRTVRIWHGKCLPLCPSLRKFK